MLSTKNCFRLDGFYGGRDVLDYGIRDGEKVLDIGGGVNPFIHATHILDSTNDEFDAQRYNAELRLKEGTIFLNGTTNDLPNYKDNEFDFIYTSHTLEHVENLPESLDEISRVGKRGFVAVPHYWYDMWAVDSNSGHKWFCGFRDNIFLLRARTKYDFITYIAEEWGSLLWGEDWAKTEFWRRIWDSHYCIGTRTFWEIRFFWYDQIDYKVDNTMFYQLDVFREMIAQASREHEEGTLNLDGIVEWKHGDEK